MSARPSLARRLVLAAALWSVAALALTAWGLSALYRQSVIRALDADLDTVVETILVGLEADGQGRLLLDPQPADPRYARPLSGRYWAVYAVAGDQAAAVIRSRSLWDEALPVPAERWGEVRDAPGQTVRLLGRGLEGEPLRLAVRSVTLPGRPGMVAVVAAADQRAADADAQRFTLTVALALAALAIGLAAAVVVQVRIGLAPLRAMVGELAAVREGRRARLDEDAPAELAPLARELNVLLDHNLAIVARARTHVGNLAHALKTPIAVLANEGRSHDGPLAELVVRQADGMARQVDHYLKRAAAAARAETFGLRAGVNDVADDVARTLARLYGRRGVDIDVQIDEPLVFRGEREDLAEIIGNLADNACKYGRSTVRVAARREGGEVIVTVDDDGPGLSAEAAAHALKRGARLDEAEAGSGLGLAITRDMAEAYGGRMALERSDLGGLRAVVVLPAAIAD